MRSSYALPLLLTALLASFALLPAPAAAQDTVSADTADAARAGAVDLTQPRFTFSPEVEYDEAIPSPAGALGYELGEHFTLYADVVNYLRALADSSGRVTMHPYAETYEGRPLHYLVITSPENHGRIEDIRQNNLALAQPATLSAEETETLIQEHPTVSWLSYNVHGNEPSSTETAMQVAYRLAAGQDDLTRRILSESVVIIDPTLNPDGRDRYVYWYKSARSAQLPTDPADLEHDEPWPGGRTNHYWFDLNRDWLWLVHPESRGRVAAYQRWLPQMHVDYHEQGYNANYFTMPGTTPRNPLLPDEYREWAERYGNANVEAFNENQISYFTREAFDFFYPGYGSSYPSLMGAIGMLTEQGGHSRGGRAVETEDGYVLTLRQRIFDHYTTSMAALETSVEHREDLLRYFHDFFAEQDTASTATYLLPDDEGTGYLYETMALLQKHGVDVARLAEADTLSAQDYWTGQTAERALEAGTFVVRADQPRQAFVNTVMQRRVGFRDSVMYDMASWSAPLAYNLEAYRTTDSLALQTRAVDDAPAPPSGLTNADAEYAYVIDWRQRNAPAALVDLQAAGYRVRTAFRPFATGGQEFSRGSLIVLLGRNRERSDSAPKDMARIAEAAGVQITGLDTGRSREGIDLASRRSRPAQEQRVALMVGPPFSSYTAGQIWHLFDQRIGKTITRLRADAFEGADLEDYDVMIFPGAWGDLSEVVGEGERARLTRWVEGGGTLVATESSARFFAEGDEAAFTSAELVDPQASEPDTSESSNATEPEASFYTPFGAREDSTGLERIPGSALRGHLDTTHPLAFGMPERIYSLKMNMRALRPSEDLHTVGYYDREAPRLLTAGYASEENLQALAGNAFAAVQPMGEGQVVFLVDNTQYRMFWVGPARLMKNAALLVPSM